jgi:hypothetical protein
LNESASAWSVEIKIERSGSWLNGLSDGGNVIALMTMSGSLRGRSSMMGEDHLDGVVGGEQLVVHSNNYLWENLHWLERGLEGVWIGVMTPGFGRAITNNETRL